MRGVVLHTVHINAKAEGLMILVFSTVLFLLGLLAAETLLVPRVPAKIKELLTKLSVYQEPIGLVGMVLGVVYLFMVVDMISMMRLAPGHFVLMAISVFLILALGVLFGLDVVRRNLKTPHNAVFSRVEQFRLFALRRQKPIGIAAIAFGLISFFEHI